LVETIITMEINDFDANAWLASFWEGDVAEPTVPYGTQRRKPNPVVDETFELASRVMDYCERLISVNATFADQILRSGTSVGSHVREGQGAQSLKAFINKMKMAHQELEETEFRLDLCHIKSHYPQDEELVRRTKILFPLFSSILSTSIARQKRERAESRKKG
jgi:four helix bundle protein